MERNYIETISDLLGDDLFSSLSNELYLKVNNKYPRINIKAATEIVESNMAVILIIGVEKKRGCTDQKLKERINWYNVCPKSLLIEKSIADIIENYKKYIDAIMKKIEEQKSNI